MSYDLNTPIFIVSGLKLIKQNIFYFSTIDIDVGVPPSCIAEDCAISPGKLLKNKEHCL